MWLCSYKSDNLDNVTSLWLVTKKRHFVLTFSVTQKQRRGRSKFCFLWDAFLSWVPLASNVSGGWLTWVPLPFTIATSVTISHGVTVRSALHWLEDTNVDHSWLSNKTKNVASTRWCSATFCTQRTWVFELKFQWEMDWSRRSIRMALLLTRSNITWFLLMWLYWKCSFCLATHNKRKSDGKDTESLCSHL